MDNIVGYICSTPWGTVSRTTPSLGWTPVLPAIPDGWQDAGTGAACILSSKNPWFCQSEFLGIATGIPW